ncbi:NUDIX hydrolase [Streptomyces sp. 7R007]
MSDHVRSRSFRVPPSLCSNRPTAPGRASWSGGRLRLLAARGRRPGQRAGFLRPGPGGQTARRRAPAPGAGGSVARRSRADGLQPVPAGWELPGGRIDPGETARQAAARELLEETGHVAEGELRFVGFAGFVLAPDRRAEYGALFTGRAGGGRPPFTPDDEIAAIRWWDLREPLPGRVQPLDAHLADRARHS